MKSEIQFIVFIFFPPWEKLTQYLYQGRYSTTANPKKKKKKEKEMNEITVLTCRRWIPFFFGGEVRHKYQ